MKKKKKQSAIRTEVKTETAESSTIAAGNRIAWGFALIVAILTFLVYLPALNNGFVNWDDGVYVFDNKAIRSLDYGFFKWVFTNEVAGLWHPLTMFSYAVNYAVWGLEPWGYHLINNIFHAFNTFLVFLLTVNVVKQNSKDKDIPEKAIVAGAVTSLLFGIHPIHVESVAWIAERKDVLCAFFYLLCLIAYFSYANSKKRFYYGACLLLFLLALMSKPMAVSLPIVLLILDFYPLGRLAITNIKTMLVEKLPFFLLSLFASSATIWAHLLESGLTSSEQIPILYRLLTAVRAYIFYLVKMVIPLNLAPLYPLPPKINPFDIEYLRSFLLLLAITFLCIWSFKRNKLWSAIWVYYIVTLIPVIGIVQVGRQSAADRYTYLPSIGLFLLVGLGVAYVYERYYKKQTLIALITISLIIFSVLAKMTVQQIAIWRDSVTLWTHEIRLFPSVPLAYSNRAGAYMKLENYHEAIKDLDMAIKLDPQDSGALGTYNNRGLAYYNIGDYQRAIEDYGQAIKINTAEPNAYFNRALLYDKLGNYQQAIKDYNKAIELNPRYVEAYDNRGGLYFAAGDYQSAVRYYSKAIELDPQYVEAYYNRGTVYNSLGSYPQAIEDFSKAIELNPTDSMYYTNRGSANSSVGNHEQAIKDYSKAVELNPKDAYAYYNLGNVYSQTGSMEQALVSYKKAAAMGLKEAQEMLANIMKKSNH